MTVALQRLLISLSAVGLLLSGSPMSAAADPLAQAPGVELVRGHCSACHSLQLVTSQRGDRKFWLKLIRWMQAEHNLWPLPADQEEAILAYLEAHYAQSDWARRPPLAPDLMPH